MSVPAVRIYRLLVPFDLDSTPRFIMRWAIALTTAFFAHAAFAADPPQSSALEVIEGNRGGRHWVDAETAQPKSPQDSLSAFEIEPGYSIQLVASEPLVHDPVSICFDRGGLMYVVEYGDYPIGPEDGGDPLSKIVVLKDTDGDGVMDQRYVFADKLDFAHSIMAYKGGLLVGAKTKVIHLRDTDGDHRSDTSETLFDGFTPAHPQMQVGNPRWGIDNWVYLNYGPGEVTSAVEPDRKVKLPRKDIRFHPHSLQFNADSGMGQYGNTINRWGHRFYCTNRNPIITTFLSPDVTARNPFHVVQKMYYDVAPSGGESRVYPLVAMKSNYLSHAGTHTAACGTTAYLGSLGDQWFRNSVFVCEPIGHVVTRSTVDTDELKFHASRARPAKDFLASTDTWFRPSSLATGPDGGLYLADMYRLWVEHPKFLPPEIAAKLDWRAGEDRGRIYRIVPEDSSPESYEPPQSTADIVQLLDSPNGWQQFLAQRLLVESQLSDAEHSIRKRLTSTSATTRLHALWALDGLQALQPADVVAMCGDENIECRVAAVKRGRTMIDDDKVLQAVLNRTDDEQVRVRFEVALTLSASKETSATAALTELALRDGSDQSFADGLLTSLADRAGAVLVGIVTNDDFRTVGDRGAINLVKGLASIVGARGDLDELGTTLDLIGANGDENWWRSAIIAGVGNGLPRHRGKQGRMSLSLLMSKPPAKLAKKVERLKPFFEENANIAVDPNRSPADRLAAIELLAYESFERSSTSFRDLLSTDQSAALQNACINALQRSGSTEAAEIVLDRWSQLSPNVRGAAVGLLLRRPESTRLALDAMQQGKMSPAALSIDQRVRLLKHSDTTIRELAVKLFGGVVSANRKQVAKEYEKALQLTADSEKGEAVFKRVCSACHRVNGQGHNAGPDLSDVRNRSKAAILYDVLDPNSKVEPRFTSYSVLTVDGSVFTGLIESESSEAIVLKMAEGKNKTIGRAEIEQMKASDVSLMPEGIEKDITPQQMADLLAYLKDR